MAQSPATNWANYLESTGLSKQQANSILGGTPLAAGPSAIGTPAPVPARAPGRAWAMVDGKPQPLFGDLDPRGEDPHDG